MPSQTPSTHSILHHPPFLTPQKTISSLVNRACITKMTGYQDDGCSINVQGEQQKKLDVLTNDVLKKALRFTGRLTVLASEEEDAPVTMEDRERIYADKRDSDVVVEEGNKYVACFDPLDGSSNVDASIPVGTIFGIFANGDEKECLLDDEDLEGGAMDPESRAAKCLMSTLQPGTNLVVRIGAVCGDAENTSTSASSSFPFALPSSSFLSHTSYILPLPLHS